MISFVLVLASILLMLKTAGLKPNNIPALFFYAFMLFLYLPGCYLWGTYYAQSSQAYMAALNVTLALYVLGVYLVYRKYPHIESTVSSRANYKGYVVWSVVALIGIAAYIVQAGEIPLFHLFANSGNVLKIAEMREDSFKLLGGSMYFYTWLRGLILPGLSLYAMIAFLSTKNKAWMALFGVSSVLCLFYAALSTAKAPVAYAVLIVALGFYFYKSCKLKWWYYLVAGMAISVFPITFYYVWNGFGIEGTGAVITGFANRLFIDPADTLYQYFKVFPGDKGWLFGRSMSWVSIFGVEPFDAANYVGLWVNPNALKSVSASTSFIGYLWADFGIVGVATGALLCGLIAQGVQSFFEKLDKSPLNLTLYSLSAFAILNMINTSLTSTLLTGGLAIIVFMAWVCNIRKPYIKNRILVVSTAHPKDDPRIVLKEGNSLETFGYEVVYLIHGRASIPVRMFRAFAWIPACYQAKANFYHLHDPELLITGFILKLITRAHVIYDAHEETAHSYSNHVAILEKLIAPRLNVIGATDSISKKFNAVTVHNYPLLLTFKPQPKPKEFTLVYCGAASKERGLVNVIDALYMTQTKLKIYGPIEKGLLDDTELVQDMGILPPKDAWQSISGYHAGIVPFLPGPNHDRSLPNKLFEYMAAGVAVICTDFPHWKAVIEKHRCGICVEPNFISIAKAIQYLKKHPSECMEMGKRGEHAILSEYNWPKESLILKSFYERMADGKPHS